MTMKLRDIPPELRERMGLKPKRSKYNNVKTVVDGIKFDSKKEAGRYSELVLLKAKGAIRWFIRQPTFHLPGGVTYRADFLIVWNAGNGHSDATVEDVKGFKTAMYRLKKRQVESIYGVVIREV